MRNVSLDYSKTKKLTPSNAQEEYYYVYTYK